MSAIDRTMHVSLCLCQSSVSGFLKIDAVLETLPALRAENARKVLEIACGYRPLCLPSVHMMLHVVSMVT